jgi:hypothetical protein
VSTGATISIASSTARNLGLAPIKSEDIVLLLDEPFDFCSIVCRLFQKPIDGQLSSFICVL